MKIQNSNMTFSSDNHFEQMDVSLEEKTKGKNVWQTRTRQARNRLESNQRLSQIHVDRVSISHQQSYEYQNNYSADLTGKSSVRSIESGQTIEFEQQSAMEKLIGGVIDKEVAIHHIQKKEDIQFSDGKAIKANIPEEAGNFLQTRSAQSWEMSLRKTDLHFEEEAVKFSSDGEVTTEDGRVINFSLDMSLNRSFLSRTEQETMFHIWQERVNLIDPLVISLNGKAPQLSDVRFDFDLNSDGITENVSFVAPGSGFLAFDKNNDNIINNGSELFGPGTGNGFEELAAFDEDQNNWIDENDAVFSKLSVWSKDENGEDKLMSLADAGVGAIALDYVATEFDMTESDNTLQGQLKSTGMFLFENGNAGLVHQIDLASQVSEEFDDGTTKPALESSQISPVNNSLGSLWAAGTDELQAADVSNPLKDLLDRLEKIKEEMEHLYDKMNPVGKQNRLSRSGQRRYRELNLDPSILLFGENKSPIRSRSRYG